MCTHASLLSFLLFLTSSRERSSGGASFIGCIRKFQFILLIQFIHKDIFIITLILTFTKFLRTEQTGFNSFIHSFSPVVTIQGPALESWIREPLLHLLVEARNASWEWGKPREWSYTRVARPLCSGGFIIHTLVVCEVSDQAQMWSTRMATTFLKFAKILKSIGWPSWFITGNNISAKRVS